MSMLAPNRPKPAVVEAMERIENAEALDPLVARMTPIADRLVASRTRSDLLHGTWLGHGLHPSMTDLPLGLWTSASVLDLTGDPGARAAARRLVGLGVLAALPTAVTGLAEWAGSGERERRVGAVHALANVAALGLYTASYRARRRDRHRTGAVLALGGAAAAASGGFLGGHLVEVRKVASRHPAFDH